MIRKHPTIEVRRSGAAADEPSSREMTLASERDSDGVAATLPVLSEPFASIDAGGSDSILEAPKEDDARVALPMPGPGDIIGGVYRVLGELGRGAMGVVLVAEDQHLKRKVAIK